MRTVYYTPKGEEWRIPAYKLVWQAALQSRWNEHFERMQGMLFGYEELADGVVDEAMADS